MKMQHIALVFDDETRPDTTGVYVRRALAELVDVTHFRPRELASLPSTKFGFDLFFFIDDGLVYPIPEKLRPTAWWAIDTHLNPDWCCERAKQFDYVFTAQRDAAADFRKSGIAAEWLPLACDPFFHRPHAGPKQWDWSFVGHLFPGPRTELIELLRREFPHCWVGQCFFDAMAKTFSASRVVFNRSLKNDINMRVFEAIASGSLLLTNDLEANGLSDLFRSGEHLATYHEAEDLLAQVRYLLSHNEERESIAARGRAEALASHTYRHRMEQALKLLSASNRVASVAHASLQDEPLAEAMLLTPAVQEEPVFAGIPRAAQDILIVGDCTTFLAQQLTTTRFDAPVSSLLQVTSGPNVSTDASHWHQRKSLAELTEDSFSPATFDAIVVLEATLSEGISRHTLKRFRRWLRSDGELLWLVPNLARGPMLKSLLHGEEPWRYGAGPAAAGHLGRTRRESEQLLVRSGFDVLTSAMLAGPGHSSWQRQRDPTTLRLGELNLVDLPKDRAEELLAASFLFRCRAATHAETGLTSVIVITHNELPYTRLCLESLRRNTDEPFELIVIDNGSTDGTVEYLRNQSDLQFISNASNRGFPAAANQGLQAARGDYLLLLNNDTVVTPLWLTRLLRAFSKHPELGLVGPCSNCVSGEQQVDVGYQDLAELNGFARNFANARDGQLQRTDRLVGFCLLLRRALYERIGPLDERFGIGCFEDDDYCRRSLAAGFGAAIVQDAFVHHFGSRTFRGSGVDLTQVIRENQTRYAEKWAEPQVAQPGLHRSLFSVRRGEQGGLELTRRQRLSLCMIVRDNERTLRAALESIRPFVDEMIVVDTGSKDRTPSIAHELGAQVRHFTWCDDFSAARNESLRHATGDWIFWMDSDDVISAECGRRLRELMNVPPTADLLGYVMQVHCPAADPAAPVTAVDHVKLFRNRPDLRFEFRIHEQILPAIRRAGGRVEWTDIYVTHAGYDHSPEGQRRKLERDLRILHQELAEKPDHPFVLFNLGMTYADCGGVDEASMYLQRSLMVAGPEETHRRKAYAYWAQALSRAGRTQEAIGVCAQGLGEYPLDGELRFRQAGMLHEQGLLAEAAAVYEDLLRQQDERHFSSVPLGLEETLARHNLALVLMGQGKHGTAELHWRKVLDVEPHKAAGWIGLADCLIALERGQEIAELRTLPQLSSLSGIHAALSAKLAESQGNTTEALSAWRTASEQTRDPDVVNNWCRLLFSLGDWTAAQEPLSLLQRLTPHDPTVYYHWAQTHLQTGNVPEALKSCEEALRLAPLHAGAAALYHQIIRYSPHGNR